MAALLKKGYHDIPKESTHYNAIQRNVSKKVKKIYSLKELQELF